jgi:drug/metabolite transporter (DMT)-like permease
MGLAFALWLSALKLTRSASRISNLVFLSPFLSLFFIRTFVGETILPSTWTGLGFIVAGLAIQQVFRQGSGPRDHD